jgi:hypothetical protein
MRLTYTIALRTTSAVSFSPHLSPVLTNGSNVQTLIRATAYVYARGTHLQVVQSCTYLRLATELTRSKVTRYAVYVGSTEETPSHLAAILRAIS